MLSTHACGSLSCEDHVCPTQSDPVAEKRSLRVRLLEPSQCIYSSLIATISEMLLIPLANPDFYLVSLSFHCSISFKVFFPYDPFFFIFVFLKSSVFQLCF